MSNVEIVHREIINPSSPTPQHLKILHLSLLDHLAIVIYIPIILFYPQNYRNDITTDDHHHIDNNNIYQTLKGSLSKTLTLFYPLAGRLKRNNTIVECNDEGAELVEARVDCLMSEILERPNPETLKKLLAVDVESKEAREGALLHVQINFFNCGGTAIGVSLSHKIADASTLSLFIKSWAAMASTGSSSHDVVVPEFSSSTLFPYHKDQLKLSDTNKELVREKCLMKRYVFEASNIAILKSKSGVENPTRIEVVSSVIWKCAFGVSRLKFRGNNFIDYTTSTSTSTRSPIILSVFSQDVNIRRRTSPPLPESLAGNLVSYFLAKHEIIRDGDDHDDDFQVLVSKLRKGIEEVKEEYGQGIDSEKMLKALKKKRNLVDNDTYIVEKCNCTSWCGFDFYGRADFGWGLPFWVSVASIAMNNIVVLLDTRDGKGIEAWVTLCSEEDVALFEGNEELRAFASFNPSVVSS